MSYSPLLVCGNDARIADAAGFAKAQRKSLPTAQFLHILIGIGGLFLDTAQKVLTETVSPGKIWSKCYQQKGLENGFDTKSSGDMFIGGIPDGSGRLRPLAI